MDLSKPISKTMEISWQAFEYHHEPVKTDWYWAVAFIGLFVAGLSLYFGNTLFAIFSILAAFTIILFKVKGPNPIEVRITPRGVFVNKSLYSYGRLESFWIFERERGLTLINELSIKSSRPFMPQVIIPLGDADVELVRDYLSTYLKEEPHEKEIADSIFELLGF